MNKVLIVDDEPFEIDLLSKIVAEAFPHTVEIKTAKNGRLAVSFASIWDADIVLMDIEMPGINGIEAAKQILEQKKDCKIIFVTAYPLFSYAREAVKLGASDYILKPVEKEDVIRSVSAAFGQLETKIQLQQVSENLENWDMEDGCDKVAQIITKVQKYLQHNYMTYGLSLEYVSDMLNLSSSYFSVVFKRCTGTNFVDYVSDLKIEAAKDLLKDPLRSANEIAGMVGFDSASYFTRSFKKKTGFTPTEFRQNGFHTKDEV
jgi:YesN/AraC family two-component response regulator